MPEQTATTLPDSGKPEGVSHRHTPGPWNILYSPYRDGTPYWRITAGKPEIYDIARNSGFQLSAIMSEADARLIAAAPDLLDACQVALGHMTGGLDGDYRDCDPREVLRTAIAKAEAESHPPQQAERRR